MKWICRSKGEKQMAKQKEIVDEGYENPYVPNKPLPQSATHGFPAPSLSGGRRRIRHQHAERHRHGRRLTQ